MQWIVIADLREARHGLLQDITQRLAAGLMHMDKHKFVGCDHELKPVYVANCIGYR